MNTPTAKRFWKDVTARPREEGFGVWLDERALSTPAKAPFVVPTEALANKIVAEWDAQKSKIDPQSMPFTRTANAAIDKVSAQKSEVADLLAAYGDSDLLCYRADSPVTLVESQNAAWDPILDWAETVLGAKLEKRTGVMHSPQNKASMRILSQKVHKLNNFELAAFHDLVSISGSLIIGFAVLDQFKSVETLWNASRIDENWQIERWGEDDEAQAELEVKRAAFCHAADFIETIKIQA
jgi:chaperone required for assembly of F1-ATPase